MSDPLVLDPKPDPAGVLRRQAGLVRSDTAPASNSPRTNTAGRAGAPSPFQPVGPSLFAPAPGGGGAGGNAGGLLFPGASPFSAALPGGHSAGERGGAGAGAPPAQGLGEGLRAGPGAGPAQGLGKDRPHGSREDRPYGSGGAEYSGGGQGLIPRAAGGRSGSGGMTYGGGGQGPGEDRPYGSGGAGFGGGGQGLMPRASGGGSGGAAPASRLPPLSPAGGGRSAQALRASAATLTSVPEVSDSQRLDTAQLPEKLQRLADEPLGLADTGRGGRLKLQRQDEPQGLADEGRGGRLNRV